MGNRELAAECMDRLTPAVRTHVKRLNQSVSILADLSLADVLVLLPAEDGTYVTVRHRRPVNARTLYPDDQVGVRWAKGERPLLDRALAQGEIEDGGIWQDNYGRWIRTLAVPVRVDGEIVAMLAREFSPMIDTVPGSLQFVSFMTLRRLAAMIADGSYPSAQDGRAHEHPPRVGDGLVLLDNRGAVQFASANAITNLTLLGVDRDPVGHRLREVGLEQNAVRSSFINFRPEVEEIHAHDHTMTLASYPLLVDGGMTGGLVLLRDITELRVRDQMLLTKDATISEIHHRVKNNLQTISSLLHLQSRRLGSDEAITALRESVRRIQSIAVVHEILSHRAGDEVPFNEIIHTLVRNVRDALIDQNAPVQFDVEGSAAVLPSDLSTTLAVVVSELVQNTIDHAFPHGTASTPNAVPTVRVRFESTPAGATLSVSDNGVGFPSGFRFEQADGLGLTIVRTLVTSELRGAIVAASDGTTTKVELRVPLDHVPNGVPTDLDLSVTA